MGVGVGVSRLYWRGYTAVGHPMWMGRSRTASRKLLWDDHRQVSAKFLIASAAQRGLFCLAASTPGQPIICWGAPRGILRVFLITVPLNV